MSTEVLVMSVCVDYCALTVGARRHSQEEGRARRAPHSDPALRTAESSTMFSDEVRVVHSLLRLIYESLYIIVMGTLFDISSIG